MEVLYKLKDHLEKEITKVVDKGDITPVELKSIGEAVDVLKDIETICAMKEYGDDDSSYAMSNRGYSSRRYSRYPGMYRDSYAYGSSYEGSYDDMSYARGGNSHDGQSQQSYARRNSRDSYSRHTEKEEMIEKLERMMNTAKSEEERRNIMECIEKLDR